jgi:hypothetical protein
MEGSRKGLPAKLNAGAQRPIIGRVVQALVQAEAEIDALGQRKGSTPR